MLQKGGLELKENLIGRIFGRYVVIGDADTRFSSAGNPSTMWLCRCECGVEKLAAAAKLKNGETKSCGCLSGEMLSARRKTHGQSGTRTYKVWSYMISRCTDTNRPGFPDYGGRGIHVCKRWKKFELFLADMGMAPVGLTLERINNEKGYGPGNCTWATKSEQAKNRRSNIRIKIFDETLVLSDWCKRFGLTYAIVRQRIRRDCWSVSKALNLPEGVATHLIDNSKGNKK